MTRPDPNPHLSAADPTALSLEQIADHMIRLAAAYFALTTKMCPPTLLAHADSVVLAGGRPHVLIELGPTGAFIATMAGEVMPHGEPSALAGMPMQVMLTTQVRPLRAPAGPIVAHRKQ